jgi:4-hydroxymandelate oxidase
MVLVDLVALERTAADRLPPHVYDYFRATSGRGDVLGEQVAAWDAFRHRPHVLRDTSIVDTATTVLGTPVSTPVLVAPMAQQVAAHPRGERETAAAAAGAGSLLGVSTNTAVPFAEIAAAGAPWWFQLYVLRDREVTEALLARALEAGARALVLTADVTGLVHPRPDAGYSVEPVDWPDSPEAERRTINLPQALQARDRGAGGEIARDLGFDTIGYLRDRTGLPVVVKGVLRGDDARRAVDAGASGVLVSTHGGRSLASVVPSAAALREVVEAVGGDAEVYADSGIRSGRHVASALALGARAVFVGRPAMWGLAVGGAEGVRAVLDGLTAELAATMNLLGAATVADLTPDLVAG